VPTKTTKNKKYQQGGRPGLYGGAGDLLTSLFGDITGSGLFNQKQDKYTGPWGDNTSAQIRDEIIKEKGLTYKTGGSFLYKNRWIDKDGNEFFKADLDALAGQMYDQSKATNSTCDGYSVS